MAEISGYLRKLPFWEKLTDDEKAALRARADVVEFPRGAIVHGARADCLGLILLLEGSLRAYLLSDEGREVSLFRLSAGDVCVLSASCVLSQITFDTQIVTEADARALLLPLDAIAPIIPANVHLECFLYKLATERFSDVMWAMQQMLFMRLDKRLAIFLSDEYARTGDTLVNMTHDQIARAMGSAREAITRMLKVFAEDGLVEYKRGEVRVTDVKRLQALARM